jgi:phytoene dehydrogenase-like protein
MDGGGADVVVIGAGFGGLSAALTAAEAGAEVVLLETLDYPGGCASTFSRGGYRFESGATLFSGFGEGQLVDGWIRRYGLPVEVDWLDPVIELRTPEWRLPIPRDRRGLVERLAAFPGAPRAGLERFFERQERIADTLWGLFDAPELLPPLDASAVRRHLRRSPRYLPLLGLIGQPLGRLLARDGLSDFAPLATYLDALCQITVQTSAAEAEAPFALAATDYCFRGTAHVRGGIGELATALVGAIRGLGGRVELATRARRLEAEGGRWRVHSRRGVFEAPVVLANLLPSKLAELRGGSSPALDGLGERVATGWGAAMLYLGVAEDGPAHPGPQHLELIADPRAPLIAGNHVFVSVSGRDERGRAPAGQRTATVSTHVPMDVLRALPESERGAWIADIQARMRRTIDQLAPEIGGSVRHCLTASPRTWARFTGRPEGLVGGVPRRAGLGHYLGAFPRAIEPGLYLVGDSAFPGQSTLATAIGGQRVARAALSRLGRPLARPAAALSA